MQRPNIVGMLSAPLDVAAQSKIIAIDLLGLLEMALGRQESRERMARRMHPSPRFDVLKIVI